jgi:hypothetical protein
VPQVAGTCGDALNDSFIESLEDLRGDLGAHPEQNRCGFLSACACTHLG